MHQRRLFNINQYSLTFSKKLKLFFSIYLTGCLKLIKSKKINLLKTDGIQKYSQHVHSKHHDCLYVSNNSHSQFTTLYRVNLLSFPPSQSKTFREFTTYIPSLLSGLGKTNTDPSCTVTEEQSAI